MILWICVIIFVASSYTGAQDPSPPKFPETFVTNYIYLYENSTDHYWYTGLIAEDNDAKLYTIKTEIAGSGTLQTLSNQNLYFITLDRKNTILDCKCFNLSYEDIGCPYFHLYQHFDLFKENKTDIIWRVTGIPLPLGVEIFFRVKRVTPNIPAEYMDRVGKPAPEMYSLNISYVNFDSSKPDPSLFSIPQKCKDIPCKSDGHLETPISV